MITGFNPRVLAGGRDEIYAQGNATDDVSIHASSREDATLIAQNYLMLFCFNPRVLAGGRDFSFHFFPSPKISFNPRVLAGGRDITSLKNDQQDRVSIHASSREDATGLFSKPSAETPVSIHASSREDATKILRNYNLRVKFQSTRPRGRTRHRLQLLDFVKECFNPRVLAGGRDNSLRDWGQ